MNGRVTMRCTWSLSLPGRIPSPDGKWETRGGWWGTQGHQAKVPAPPAAPHTEGDPQQELGGKWGGTVNLSVPSPSHQAQIPRW